MIMIRANRAQKASWNQAGELPKMASRIGATKPISGCSMLRQIRTETSTGIGQGMIKIARMILLPGRLSNNRVTINPTTKLKNTEKKVKARFQPKIFNKGWR